VVGPHAVIAVSDTGIGMDDETLSHIWEPFFTTKGVGQGTGLGLSSVYGVVKQSNGNIWVYSEPGRGTTFKVYLPRAASTESATAPGVADTPQPGQGTILVAEDEAVVRDLLVVMLQQQGYRVLTTIDGQEALEILQLRGAEIDLIISDVVMPNVGGLEFVERAAEIKPGLPAVLISGYTANALPKGQAQNAIYLEKPFTARQLGDVIHRALDQPVLS
jgi:CheY-like chemotaxis protein